MAANDHGVAASSHIYHHHEQQHGYNNNVNDNDNNDCIHEKHEINDKKDNKRARQKEMEVRKLDADSSTCRRIYNPICLWTNYSRRATDVSAAS
jgi:hypothetical protein